MENYYLEILTCLYGEETAPDVLSRFLSLLKSWRGKMIHRESATGDRLRNEEKPDAEVVTGQSAGTAVLPLTERDAFLITYGDQFLKDGERPLVTLKNFLDNYLDGVIEGVHILPFFPYTSDDGFSISDYRSVNPGFGTWDDIRAIASEYRFMADLVLNHCSAEHEWFRKFLADEGKFRDYFITVEPGTDITSVVRPRALPLLTAFITAHGEELVWTTFSADQVDLNFSDPEVLLEMLDIFLFYLSQGSGVIRLDAIAYLWKEPGTPSIHHPKTHAVVKLMRALIDDLLPEGVLITETNVPHSENLSYFGNGSDEAHMVYNFSLPPLVLHAFLKGDASYLSSWAGTLPEPDGKVTFFNFLASHDGIGVLPARGILPDGEIDDVIGSVLERGGFVSRKSTPSGDIPYELNINYFDAIAEKNLSNRDRARKFLTSQAVMLSLAGVPGIYVHSIVGSGNWREGVKLTGANRSINRRKLSYEGTAARLSDSEGVESLVFEGFRRMLSARRTHTAFHPSGAQRIVPGAEKESVPRPVFAVERTAPDGSDTLLCLHNTSGNKVLFELPRDSIFTGENLSDLISGKAVRSNGGTIEIGSWETLWLTE